jgi:hypothetical protein
MTSTEEAKMTPANKDELESLAKRCETATEGSRVLDFEIHIAMVGDAVWPVLDRYGRVLNPDAKMSDYLAAYHDVIDDDDQDFDFPRYSSSIDAALTLVPEHCLWIIEKGAAWVSWLSGDDVKETQARCANSALAVSAAAIRARAQGGEQ